MKVPSWQTPALGYPSKLEREALQEVERLRAENERLRAALKECSDDLENEIKHRYSATLDYPSQKLKFDRDMETVLTARKLLAVDEQPDGGLTNIDNDRAD